MLENLKENLETHTLDELKEIYKLPKTKLLKEIESQSLSVLYERRTPLTHALIPVSDKRLNKYGNNSKRQKVNQMMCEDFEQRNWPDCEIKRCEEGKVTSIIKFVVRNCWEGTNDGIKGSSNPINSRKSDFAVFIYQRIEQAQTESYSEH